MWRAMLTTPAGKAGEVPIQVTRSVAMQSFIVVLKSLVVALMLSGSALAADKVNINSAGAEEIDQVLVNVGASKAQAIVDYRQAHGPFKSAEELALVKGIGLKTVERNRDRIEVGATKAPAPTAAKQAAAKPVERR
ncbi:ComEA family DNA-binding protein [Xanthomonas rydalmerensis]|uniref:ComEA family DNA-binding protein n=2 Tax=Xanthomonas TaxID=338 RepID=A0ABZ0JT58_9XANT|nr:ComEA family DNA-binding protein [Xanthomonas sp. LMG 9002]WOS42179.1 ComEA family DNA-binding protein [Xanthomonas sp. DM-2023]WOS46365.1 ComEA family DNA-binding protein [Xanthomonas sp. DM-2023]WOS50544.1 ComEA family DNA-binding protein [Xanthomonas sp. DM-2023]WOS54724.1 ComEA family DNA-binding protein [Xanthomonas sp. DM-2023]WOS58907.1 ComEA family DNA-binding protein [Xanthomonas sp. DM-2023]